MKKIGIIDVGSNSHRLLAVAVDGETITELARGKITTRMLSGLVDGAFTFDAIMKNIHAIAQLKEKAAQVGCTEFIAFATSAMRDAGNRQQVIDLAADIGVEMRVLSGDEEAEMAYAGVNAPGRVGIVDIGGGSTEMLTGADGHVMGGGSAQMGAVRLSAKCPEGTPREVLIAEAKQVLALVFAQADKVPVDRWVGVGGTVTTLTAMELKLAEYDAARIQDYCLTRERISQRLDEMMAMTLEERRHLMGLQPERADIICAGAAILMAFFELSGAQCVYASDSDNLMGFLLRCAKQGRSSILSPAGVWSHRFPAKYWFVRYSLEHENYGREGLRPRLTRAIPKDLTSATPPCQLWHGGVDVSEGTEVFRIHGSTVK